MIATVLGFVTSKVGRWVAIAGGVLLAIFTVFQRGKAAQKAEQEKANLQERIDVRERVDEAVRLADGDTRDVDERLRGHKRLRD